MAQQPNDSVTRQEFRSLNAKEQERFMNAIAKMMENKNNTDGASEFYRLACYYGEQLYCMNGTATFLGWNRIYLYEFEKSLQLADRTLGNDGKIGLCYWDWTYKSEEGLPDNFRNRFSAFPKDLLPSNLENNDSTRLPCWKRNPDTLINFFLKQYDIINKGENCLFPTPFGEYSSENSGSILYPSSLEEVHNAIHSIIGGSMGVIDLAAFDPIFWLHHCNIDRIYEQYLQNEPNLNKLIDNLDNKPLLPFQKIGGDYYYLKDTLNTLVLDYQYDKVPIKNNNNNNNNVLNEPQYYVIFENLKISTLKPYLIHIFLIEKGKGLGYKEPNIANDLVDHPNYANCGAIYTHLNNDNCKNCQNRSNLNLVINISNYLKQHSLSHDNCIMQCYAIDNSSDDHHVIPIENTLLPKPFIVESLLENSNSVLNKIETSSEINQNVNDTVNNYGNEQVNINQDDDIMYSKEKNHVEMSQN